MRSTVYSLLLPVSIASSFLAGCGGEGGGITTPTGSIEITTATSGEPIGDYTISVDGGAPSPIGANATVTLADIQTGSHAIALGGLPQGCTVSGENPQTVSVTAGAGTTVSFAVTCVPSVGIIQITTATTGPAPASYDLLLDAISQGPIAPSAVLSLPNVPVGSHTVGLAGVPPNCQLTGQNPQSISLEPGATLAISFVLSCTNPPAQTGTLTVTTATTGSDPDGFRVVTDGGAAQPIALSGTLTVPNIAVGNHTVRLAGLASNCTVTGSNPRTVTISAGATATVAFVVQCSPVTGSIRVATVTAGSNLDPDGFTFTVDDGAAQPIGTTGSVTVADLTPGPHVVSLSGLAENCTVADNSQTVTVRTGSSVDVTFTVTCSPPNLRWTRMESGTSYSLIDVWGSAAGNVFAVGERGSGFHGGIFHYDGRSWAQTYSEDGPILEAVWGAAPNDVLAVGSDPLGVFSHDGIILRFDGSAWSRMTGPGVGTEDGSREVSFHGVWGSSSTDVYAVGAVFDQISHALIARFDGTRWTAVPLATNNDRVLEDVHGTSASDVYAVGFIDLSQSLRRRPGTPSLRVGARQGSFGLILHYNGTSWSEFTPSEPDVLFNGVWSNAPNDVFAVGGRGSTGVIYHFDGTTRTPMAVPSTGELFEIWGAAANNVYAAGARAILHYDGVSWSVVQSVPERLRGIWGNSPADVFAVGSAGAIYHGPPAPVAIRR